MSHRERVEWSVALVLVTGAVHVVRAVRALHGALRRSPP